VKPVLTAEEMAGIDRRAQETVGIETLIARAGFAVARYAVAALGGTYGRRVVVVAGKGHNGDDGRTAARLLQRRGARVEVVAAHEAPARLPECDLVIDAAFGTGFRGEYAAPTPPSDAVVLAVDIPSGVLADTGRAAPGAVAADLTVTFGALKPGLLLGAGADHCGILATEPIGLDASSARQHLVESSDLSLLPARPRETNKWKTALGVIAGSPGMYGSAAFATSAAVRSGAGMVRLASPGVPPGTIPVLEAVAFDLHADDWAQAALDGCARCKAVVIGPGLGRRESTGRSVVEFVERADVPLVIDADGLIAFGAASDAAKLLSARHAPTVLTPHDGEFARLAGEAPGEDRVASTRQLAARLGAIVLLKGPTTIVAAPSGEVLFATAGTPRLATAGTGDVLSGVIGAFIARGMDAFHAAALGAHVHGIAASAGFAEGLEASDLPLLVASKLSNAAEDVGTA
jgi:ADP-dependent NAD(P)H-hydrate dehydratase / NAD(P)H-hydrate epimerase